MLVAIVTAPGTPASAIILASSAWNRAFSTLCGILRLVSSATDVQIFRLLPYPPEPAAAVPGNGHYFDHRIITLGDGP